MALAEAMRLAGDHGKPRVCVRGSHSSVLAAGTETCSPIPIPFKFPMAGGRSIGSNSHLTRVSGFSLGGIWETGERF